MNKEEFLDHLSGGQFSKAKLELAIRNVKLNAKDTIIDAQRKKFNDIVVNLCAKNNKIRVTMGLREKVVTDILGLTQAF
ncbi:MAG: hypothetical protein LBT47_04015 [Deltaproteobacteria bacterium]|jgi:hypothetical protein|nr:hypothetical protein [Deltaproteobacteria bacterium]